jgi:hypothetical protein
MDFERTIRTLKAQNDLETAKAEIFRQLAEAELEGGDADALAGVLVQLGISIWLATTGPAATVARLALFMKTLSELFPKEWSAVANQKGKH